MATYEFLFKAIIFLFSRILHFHYKTPRYLHRQFSNALNNSSSPHRKLHKYSSFTKSLQPCFSTTNDDDDHQTVIFNVEETLLKSSSLFPYFMLVAFEAGTPIRALILLLLYPITCLFGKQMRVKIMVMVCFFGIKKDKFMVGRAVLPKFFLEDVGLEGFEVVNKFKTKVGVTELPQIMVESFLKDYLEIDYVFGRELKVYNGYFIGLMEQQMGSNVMSKMKDLLGDEVDNNIVGICGTRPSLKHPFFSFCKEIYLSSAAIKKKWQQLPRESYPKPLIFHDGRLSLKPTPAATFTLFLWLPFAFILAIFRALIVLSLPKTLGTPLIAFTGLRLLSNPPNPYGRECNNKGQLYVCNHRTLLDPLYLSYILMKPLTAVTYSLSRISEMLAPIRTVRLTRDRNQDGLMMQKLLSQGDLVVCPEGTTCREPYVLRFSPLFAEMTDQIVPVALDCHVTMFYGTTASGLKCLDPLFFLLNPRPSYTVQLLQPVRGLATCQESSRSKFDVANHVQRQIGEALSFRCTNLTRKDKYLILAGNHGVV
ncbi:putative glycerol-3-phosphate acyltransferase 3 [Silene latifolia]|uniref:putative glycerol-3-phosphate acyltransferase 3 n=1 Tax=Silene latifolia TaxID=37657 RepID=UPI003D77C853